MGTAENRRGPQFNVLRDVNGQSLRTMSFQKPLSYKKNKSVCERETSTQLDREGGRQAERKRVESRGRLGKIQRSQILDKHVQKQNGQTDGQTELRITWRDTRGVVHAAHAPPVSVDVSSSTCWQA